MTFLLVAGLLLCLPLPAHAHMKWFIYPDFSEAPLSPGDLAADPLMWVMTVGIVLAMALAAWAERLRAVQPVFVTLDGIRNRYITRLDDALRTCVAIHFVMMWSVGGIILTPELRTDLHWLAWPQMIAALAVVFRRTAWIGGLAILSLYWIAGREYSWFHALDYPVFVGLAAYLILVSSNREAWLLWRWVPLRWGSGLTMLWGAAEKWLYPHRVVEALNQQKQIMMGLDPTFVGSLTAAVEFGLGLALLLPLASRRLAALVLSVIFMLAIIPFGRIDAIGHFILIAILLALALEPSPPRRFGLSAPAAAAITACALVATLAVFYGAQAFLAGG